MNIKKYLKSKVAYCIPLSALLFTLSTSSCSDMLDTSSDMVEFAEDHTLNTPEDSLYSVMGVIRKMQNIADRTIILGDVRSDLVITTNDASIALKQVANFNVNADVNNKYNNIADYYAIINNCNYFIANADTALSKLGKKIFEKEFAAMKTYRAWTYLQLAKVYGKVPLILKPILTENQAQEALKGQFMDVKQICDYFIDDIKPYVDTNLPQYGVINNTNSKYFFVPVRVLLGEMCLWSGRYQEASEYFYNYITKKNNEINTYTSRIQWRVTNLDFTTASSSNGLSFNPGSTEVISYIPMEATEFTGVKSMLKDVYCSTENNYYHYEAGPSKVLFNLSASQDYTLLDVTSETQKDTVKAPKGIFERSYYDGDLRLRAYYSQRTVNQNETSKYSTDYQTISKFYDTGVSLYRRQYIYLMFAEALCRAGYPETAFCILKYGLRQQNVERYISLQEQERAGALITFNNDVFTEANTLGIHARGCGDVECDTTYCLPMPPTELASYQDTIAYQIPLLEDMIINEMALETAFEGTRYYDLMRVAIRRNDPSYLARPVSKRNGVDDTALYNLLMDQNNWYLPVKK